MTQKTKIVAGLILLGMVAWGENAAAETTAAEVGDFVKRITVTPAATIALGADVAFEDLPVLLRLSEAVEDFAYADFKQEGGNDLMVTDETGAVLPYEIELWNPSGESLIWTKVPRFSADTRLTVYYGAEDVVVVNDPTAVWGDYAGVWHFDEQQAAGSCRDSSPSGYHTANQENNVGDANGIFGGARNMATGSILVPNTTTMNLGGKFTVEGWVTRTSVAGGSWDHLFYKKNQSGNWGGWCTELYGEGGAWGKMTILGRDRRVNTSAENVPHGLTETDTWYHLLIVYDETSATLYNNGMAMGTSTFPYASTWTGDNIRDLAFGGASDGTGAGWKGSFDEFRIRAGAISAERAALEHSVVAAEAFTYKVANNADTRPVLTQPVVARTADGAYTVTVSLTAGVATSIKAVCDGVEQELAPAGASAGWSVTETLTGLAADTCYTLKVVAVNDDDFEISHTAADAFYTGTITVTKVADAREEKLVAGALTFSRSDTPAAMAHALKITYAIGGSAEADSDYEALRGTLTIPAGESSVTVPVVPRANPWTDTDVSVVVTVADGLYAPAAETATVMIYNCREAALSSFSRRTTLTFPGYTHETPVTNMPVLVRLKEQAGVFSYADIRRDDHGDLAFYTVGGTRLPYEIDTWDPNGTSLIWVRVLELKRDTTIYMLYGSGAGVMNDPTQVWDGYVGVWHMNETESGASVKIADSSAHQLHGTTPEDESKIDPDGNRSVDGAVGGGRKISTVGGPAEKGRILVRNNEAKDLYTERRVTASMWFRIPEGMTENWAYLIDRKARDDWDVWGLQFNAASAATSFRFYYESGGKNIVDFGTAFSKDRWHHVVAIWTEGYNSLYVDGREIVRGQSANWLQYNQKDRDLAIGGLVNANGDKAGWGVLPGDVDEVRVQKNPYSKEQAISEYEMVVNEDYTSLFDTVSFSSNRPVVDYARLSDDGKFVELPLVAGTADVYAIIRTPDGVVTTNRVVANVTGPTVVAQPLSQLPQAGWIDVRVLAVSARGDYDERDWSFRHYNLRKPQQIQYVVRNAQIEAQSDFPALVRVGAAFGGFDARLLCDTEKGSDIWFTDERGNELAFELDTWNPEDESLFWVKLPRLARGTKIFLNYGSADRVTAPSNVPSQVWSGLTGVWHADLTRADNGNSYALNSAKEDPNTLRAWPNGKTTEAEGAVGRGRLLSTAERDAKDGCSLVVGANDELDALGDTFTVSGWFRYYKVGQGVSYDRLFSRKSAYNSTGGWEVSLSQDKAQALDIRGGAQTSYSSDMLLATPINDGTWHFLTITYMGETVSAYENGVKIVDNQSITTAASASDQGFVIGDNGTHKEVTFKGTVDEIRLGGGTLSAARIRADYETVADRNFFTARPYKPGFVVIIR